MTMHRLTWLLLAWLLLTGTFAQAQSNEALSEQQTLLDLYRKSIEAENYKEALEYTTRLIKLGETHLRAYPHFVGTYYGFHGRALAELERYDEAAPAFESALTYLERVRPRNADDIADITERLADSYWYQDAFAKAAAQYERVLKHRRNTLGDQAADTRRSCRDVALCYFRQKDYANAEKFYRLGLTGTQAANRRDPEVARWWHDVADCQWNQQQREEAAKLYAQALALRQQELGVLHEDTLFSQRELVDAYERLDRNAAAEVVLQDAVKQCEAAGEEQRADVATALLNLAGFYERHGQEKELEPIYQRVISLREAALGKDHPDLANTLHEIGNIYHERGKYRDAERYHQRGLAIREAAADVAATDLAYSRFCLGIALQVNGKYREAETRLRQARALYEEQLGDDTEEVAGVVNRLADLYHSMGRLAEANAAAQRVLAMQTKRLGGDALELAEPLALLGNVHLAEGRYADAEAALRRALAIQEQHLGAEHVDLTFTLDNLANVLQDQRRLDSAQALRERALAIGKANLAEDHPSMAHLLNNLASLREAQADWPTAKKLYVQALEIWEQSQGEQHPNVAYGLHNVANCEAHLGEPQLAEPRHRRALAIRQQSLGADHPLVAESWFTLGEFLVNVKRGDEAEPCFDHAITSLERSRATPSTLLQCYAARANLAWQAKRSSEALSDLHRAMDLAEQVRGQSGGAEQERAQNFSRYAKVFETMVAWQVTAGDVGEALAAIERSRARSLLDEMNLGGADLNAGNSAQERAQAAQREAELKEQIAQCEQQLTAASSREERERIGQELETARGQLYEHYRNQRSASAVYRNLLAVGGSNVRIRQLQRRLQEIQGQLLVYFLGEEGGYLLSIRGDTARLYPLAIAEEQAKTLGHSAAPITNEVLRGILMREDGAGVVQLLANPKQAPPADMLHALWLTLLPAEVRSEILATNTKRLLVIPDGTLNLLPFETLVVSPGDRPHYLLQAGPPVVYGPSATVLYNLYERAPATRFADAPVVTLGDPAYDDAPPAENATQPSSSSRYGRSGGRLTPLPHTGIEANWVADVFHRNGLSVAKLIKGEATEAKLRAHVAGRKVIHLACHGLTDQTYGNFFGALALTAGTEAATNPDDDGFLTLAEIYGLDLRGCELAILSACETNYGPQQQGEGTWALSRGFLVAGSRRVLASNWLVDDQAGASLVSYYCGGIAKQQAGSAEATDYAAALQASKRWLAEQPKWQHPYYWGALVLVGPQ